MAISQASGGPGCPPRYSDHSVASWLGGKVMEISHMKWGFHGHGGTPIAGWFIRKHTIKMDEDWGYPYIRKPRCVKISHMKWGVPWPWG